MASCSDDSNNININFYETVWKGTFQEYSSGKSYYIQIWFEDDKVGHYRYTIESENDKSFENLHTFNYYLDGKILLISTLDASAFDGYWWIVKKKGDTLYLTSEPESPYANSATLKQIKI